MNEVDNKRIKDFLLEKRADWIAWKKNPPMASHMGGVWEKNRTFFPNKNTQYES